MKKARKTTDEDRLNFVQRHPVTIRWNEPDCSHCGEPEGWININTRDVHGTIRQAIDAAIRAERTKR